MNTSRLKRALAGVALVAGLMAMALSCGGSAESPAMAMEDSGAYAPAAQQAQSAAATRAPVAASDVTTESLGLDSSPLLQAAEVAQQASEPASARAVAGTPSDGSANSRQVQSGRQLIVEAWVSLEVGEIDGVVRQVEAIAGQRGGWVESADIVGEAGYRTATINVRVPSDRFNDAMQTLRGLGRVTDEGVSSTDVTDRLIDNEARMEAWKVQEERLIVLLENAATVEDVIDIERRISEVRADIEQVAATQRNLENRVTASLIRVNLHLPGRFASDPPNGSLTLAVGDPGSTANTVTERVESLNGYVGRKREYQEGRGQVVELTAHVKPADLAGLLDYAGTLGETSERRLNSVGPSPVGDVPNARLILVIRSNVDSAASLSLEASEPMTTAAEIRARVESLGGYVESWNESRWAEGESISINADLVVKAADLRELMDFGAGLGKVVAWEYHSSGQSPSETAPNSRLSVSVYTGDDQYGAWIVAGVIVGVLVIAGAGAVAALVFRQRKRRRGAESDGNGVNRRQPLEADDGDDGNGNEEV